MCKGCGGESKKQKQQEVDSDGFTTVTVSNGDQKLPMWRRLLLGYVFNPEPVSTSVNDTSDDGTKQDAALGTDLSPLVGNC
ncbi:hypothetical protein OSB04_un001751 [Centaurea solstitialis]|uniref:Uncharacterized protein n=1 Tax=Centaurea solstitialis TaxID=347529 RepID=A0AA38S1K8_9ASTR|nr:hypothetical protein OSB04_un001751 [Centaurea solstitialis]